MCCWVLIRHFEGCKVNATQRINREILHFVFVKTALKLSASFLFHEILPEHQEKVFKCFFKVFIQVFFCKALLIMVWDKSSKINHLSHNRPFPSCFESHYESEAKCKAFGMKIRFHSLCKQN